MIRKLLVLSAAAAAVAVVGGANQAFANDAVLPPLDTRPDIVISAVTSEYVTVTNASPWWASATGSFEVKLGKVDFAVPHATVSSVLVWSLAPGASHSIPYNNRDNSVCIVLIDVDPSNEVAERHESNNWYWSFSC